MYTRKQALALARQYRTCPPPHIRNNPSFKNEIYRHTAQCPFCSIEQDNDDDWARLAEKIRQDFPHLKKPGAKPARIKPGQLRPILSEPGIWHNGFFYSPPEVLILDESPAGDKAVTVAQTYNDLTLAGPGDLIVGPPRVFPYEFFIEAWNIYTLTGSRLGPLICTLPDKVVEAVKRMDQDPDYLPDWADCTPRMVDEDPRIYFREMEIEVGYMFSAPAVSELMADLEAADDTADRLDLKKIMTDIQALTPGLAWNNEPSGVAEALLTASFPDAYHRLAAAPVPGTDLEVRLFQVKENHVAGIKRAGARIIGRNLMDNTFTVSGKIHDLPEDIKQAEFLCCLIMKNKNMTLFPELSGWDEAEGDFFARFTTPPGFMPEDYALRLAFLCKEP